MSSRCYGCWSTAPDWHESGCPQLLVLASETNAGHYARLLTMKVRIEDGDALRQITPAAIKAYVERLGWRQVEGERRRDLYLIDQEQAHTLPGYTIQNRYLHVPDRDDYVDYASCVGLAIRDLAAWEARTELAVYEDLRRESLKGLGSDDAGAS